MKVESPRTRRDLRALGEHLAAGRKIQGLTQQDLADRAGISRTTLTQTFTPRACSCAEGGMTAPEVSEGVVNMMFYGATMGLRFGGWRVQGLLEMTVGNTEATPVIFGKKRSLGGATIQPNIGLGVSF